LKKKLNKKGDHITIRVTSTK